MDQTLKARWVEALRSGEYEQCRSLLYRKDKEGPGAYCCLGVLSAIQDGIDTTTGDYEIGYATLDNQIRTEGFSDLLTTLTTMNDTQNMSFNEIADWVEKNL